MANPIPVTERLPGPDDMKNGRCWWFFPETDTEFPYWNFENDGRERELPATHWLPAYALPLPTDALSQPAPEPPTGEKLTALVRVFQSAYNAKRSELRALPSPYREDTAGDMADHAGISAVLARWGQGND